MANVFFNLPSQVGNGVGAAVDVSTAGSLKTIVVSSGTDATITVEFSNQAAPAQWAIAASFRGGGNIDVNLACWWMRVRVTGYRRGPAPDVEVGATDDGALFANLPAPAGNGTAAPVDVSALGIYKTIQVGDAFRGALNIEISEDGVAYSTLTTFYAPGSYSKLVSAQFMRTSRNGVPQVAPGLPVVDVGATQFGGGGGGGGGGSPQAFTYQVTGLEPDLSELTITLPAARSTSTYLVFPSQQAAANLLGMCVDDLTKGTTTFVLTLSSDAQASDVFAFYVVDSF